MEKTNSLTLPFEQEKSIIKLLPIRSGSTDKCKLTLTVDLLEKIEYLCREFPNREWSGVLFYTAKGDTMDTKNLELTAFDLYPMDLGSTTYTEFTHSPDFAGYIAKHPELMDSLQGLIHSHHHMNSFFSGTDTATLQEMAPIYGNYLSLIVNNKGLYTAAIATKVTTEEQIIRDLSYKSIDFQNKNIKGIKTHINKEEVLKFDCDIIKEGAKYNDLSFVQDVEELKRKDAQKQVKTNYPTNQWLPSTQNTVYTNTKASQQNLFNDVKKNYYNSYEAKKQAFPSFEEYMQNQEKLFQKKENKVDIKNFILSVASLSYAYESTGTMAFEKELSIIVTKATRSISLGQYEELTYDIIDNCFRYLGIINEDEQADVLEKALDILDPLQDNTSELRSLYTSFEEYALALDDILSMEQFS